MKRFAKIAVLVVIVQMAGLASAEIKVKKNPLANTPLDTGTWNIPKPNFPKPPANSPSHLPAWTDAGIEADGRVYGASSNTGQARKYYGQCKYPADVVYEGNLAYWTWKGPPYVKNRRAPQFDRTAEEELGKFAPGTPSGDIKLNSGPVMSTRHDIDPRSGQVTRSVFKNGKLSSSRVVGTALLEVSSDGRFWVYQGKRVRAIQGQQTSQPPQQPPQQPPFQQQSPEVDIAVGILQIIDGALKSGNRP